MSMLPRLLCLLTLGAIVATALACARAPLAPFSQIRTALTGGPPELGTVAWLRTYDDAVARARRENRPILLLFQEVPGCQTCVDFGRDALSHPLVVDAIEQAFVPLAIHNNAPGHDDAIRRRFEEPSWNYPVARFIDADGTDIIARRDGIWSREGLIRRMIVALRTAGRPVPETLRIAHAEARTQPWPIATFAMHCYWEGEAQLGALDGAITTTAGWKDGMETVDVRFDPERVTYDELVRAAMTRDCARVVFAHTDDHEQRAAAIVGAERVRRTSAPSRPAKASDQSFSIGRHAARYLPLTAMQRTKVNAALRLGTDPARWLTSEQRALLPRLVTALAQSPDRLRGAEPPTRTAEWPAYLANLRERLATDAPTPNG